MLSSYVEGGRGGWKWASKIERQHRPPNQPGAQATRCRSGRTFL